MKDILDKSVKGGFNASQFYIGLDGGADAMENYLNSIKEKIIFQIPFLKAFFGEHRLCEDCLKKPAKCWCKIQYTNPAWMVHAKKLVLSEDRKSYLKRFI